MASKNKWTNVDHVIRVSDAAKHNSINKRITAVEIKPVYEMSALRYSASELSYGFNVTWMQSTFVQNKIVVDKI